MKEKIGKNVRVWRVKEDSPGGIGISENSVTIQGDKNTFIDVRPGSISLSADKLNFAAQPESITKGIIFSGQLGMMGLIPSTVTTPIPQYIMSIPGAGLAKNISEGTPALAALNFVSI